MPKIMKNEQQISTVFPIGRSEDSSDSTTSFKPGALLIARSGRSVRIILNIFSRLKTRILLSAIELINKSTKEHNTRKKSIRFHPSFKYAYLPLIKP